ncbi:type II toxin-antitoxin system HicB family antitoxin [Breznakiellaceae bacterium SP9]
MRKTTYLAVFEPVADGSYSVYFPDVAACISCGANFEHAHKMAEQALSLHLYALEKQGEAFPSVSELPRILLCGSLRSSLCETLRFFFLFTALCFCKEKLCVFTCKVLALIALFCYAAIHEKTKAPK